MLPKKNRISRKEFPSHKRQGFRVFSTFFSGTIYPTRGGESPRALAVSNRTGQSEGVAKVSVVVSKKTAKTAVARNYLRRIFYEATSDCLDGFLVGAIVVFYPKIEAQKAPLSVLKEEIKKVLRQAKLVL